MFPQMYILLGIIDWNFLSWPCCYVLHDYLND